MIQLFKEEDGLTYALLSELHLWEKNPRDVDQEEYNNLVKMTDLGEFDPLLVMVEDGTTLGGNTRSRVYREKGFEKVWISRIRFEFDEETQLWYAYVNDKKAKRTFTTQDQAMLEYALASNSQTGRYNSQALAELAIPYQHVIPPIYKVTLAYPVKIQSILDSIQPSATVPDSSDPSDTWGDMPEFNQEDKSAYKQLLVNFENEDDFKNFAELIQQNITTKTKSIWYPAHEEEKVNVEYSTEENTPQ